MMDPFLSLLLAATATERLLIGTGVALPLEHDLSDLAKSVATLDRLSGGRLLFGVGVGSNKEELANHRPVRCRCGTGRVVIGGSRAGWDDPAPHCPSSTPTRR